MSQAGSPNDGVTIDLLARDQGASAALDQVKTKAEGAGEAIENAASGGEKATRKLTKSAEEGAAQYIEFGAAVALFHKALQTLKNGIEEYRAIQDKLVQNAKDVEKAFGLGGIPKNLDEIQTKSVEIERTYDAQVASAEKLKDSIYGIQGQVNALVYEIDAQYSVQLQLIESAKHQAELALESKKREQERTKEAERQLDLARQIAKIREENEQRFQTSLEKSRDLLEKINTEARDAETSDAEKLQNERIDRIDEISQYESVIGQEQTKEAIKNIDTIYEAKLSKIREQEQKEIESERKKAAEEQKRAEDRARENEREFQRQQNRNAASALANSMWAGAPDFFSAANDGVTMDLLIRTGRN